jgi:hypothetical protein
VKCTTRQTNLEKEHDIKRRPRRGASNRKRGEAIGVGTEFARRSGRCSAGRSQAMPSPMAPGTSLAHTTDAQGGCSALNRNRWRGGDGDRDSEVPVKKPRRIRGEPGGGSHLRRDSSHVPSAS